MAKVVEDNQQVVVPSWWNSLSIVAIGVAIGLLWWVILSLFNRFALNLPATTSGVAGVLVAVTGILALIRYSYTRPLIIAVASAVVLWRLGVYIDGLAWYESLFWPSLFFGLSYWLFSMVAHIKSLWFSLALSLLIIVTTLIVLSL